MTQQMPEGDFNWVDEEEFRTIDWVQQLPDQPFGFFVECDMEYPQQVHPRLHDYTLALEKFTIDFMLLTEAHVALPSKYSIPQSSESEKLEPNLRPKALYGLPYFNFKFYLQQRMGLTKDHLFLKFRQSAWLAPYTRKNQDLRAAAQNEFAKDFFKLMKNMVYAKTCKNLKKRTDIKLLVDLTKSKKLLLKPHCLGFTLIGDNHFGSS